MKKHYLLYSFCISILLITLIDVLEPIKEFSEIENKYLKGKIKITKEKILNGDIFKEYDKYINEQMAFRDELISLKAISEKFFSKIENNDVLLGKDNYLFHKYFELDEHRKDYNTDSINKFKNNYNGNVSLLLVPSSYEIYKENLIGNPPVINESKEIQEIYSKMENINTVDILDELKTNKDDYLYYKTDHHWTIDGAYIGYEEFMKSLNLKPIDVKSNRVQINDFLGSFYSKAKPILNKGDILSYIPIDDLEMSIGKEQYDSIYNLSYLEKRDKYSVYLNGNNPYVKIENKVNKNGKKILVIKDSFANSFIPYLTSNYEEVHIIDFRSFSQSLKGFLENNKYDEILILYSFKNFCTESTLLRIKD